MIRSSLARDRKRLIEHLRLPKRGLSFAGVTNALTWFDNAFFEAMNKKVKPVATAKQVDEMIGGATAYLDPDDPGEEDWKCIVTIEGVRVPGDFPKELCIIVLIVLLVVLLVIWIKGLVAEAETDEGPRALFNSTPCSELERMSTNDIVLMLEDLSRGPTLDGDEHAILRLFDCLSCRKLGRGVELGLYSRPPGRENQRAPALRL